MIWSYGTKSQSCTVVLPKQRDTPGYELLGASNYSTTKLERLPYNPNGHKLLCVELQLKLLAPKLLSLTVHCDGFLQTADCAA